MSKFGELIDTQVPVLIDFFTDWNDVSISMNETIRHVAAALGDRARVIKIDVEKNQELAEALRIKGVPTLMIYKNGEMVWRQTGEKIEANTLISLIEG
jgi:thioredoxin 1